MATLAGKGRQIMGNQLARALSFASALLFLYFAIKVFVDGYSSLMR
jgi:L-lysine exporter family protein LysE/ArgO